MEQYKEKLKIQNAVMSLCCLVLLIFCIAGFASEAGLITLIPQVGDSHWHSQWRGFLSGASCGVMALMVYGIFRNLLALKDSKKLKKLYIQMHDERQLQVFLNARSSAMSIALLLGLATTIVSGYFSMTVSITILVCVLVCSCLCMVFKLYYNKKF